MTEVQKHCKKCYIKQGLKSFPVIENVSGRIYYRNTCTKCMNESAKLRKRVLTENDKKPQNKNANERVARLYVKNMDVRDFDNYEFEISVKFAKRLNRKPYFEAYKFDHKEIVTETCLKMLEGGLIYTRHRFYCLMWNVMSKIRYDHIRDIPGAWHAELERGRINKAAYRRTASIYYIKKLLSGKFPIDYIDSHPELIEAKRIEILNLRNNGNSPIDNGIPVTTEELIDLSLIDVSYKGYAITAQGELYSCKSIYRTDTKYTQRWYILAKRKDGCVRMNICGEKKDFSVKRLLERVYKLDIQSI